MKLQLIYQEIPSGAIKGAYLTGSPKQWFAEISTWAIDPLSIELYLVPQSISDRSCSGILVIFKAEVPHLNKLRFPLTQAAEGFYIPLHARLFPAVTAGEIDSIRLWPIQLFHPAIGLFGFELNDAKSLKDLITKISPEQVEWLTQIPVAAESPRLKAISVMQAETENVVDELKELMGIRPLSEIPDLKDEKSGQSFFSKLPKPIKDLALWILLVFAFIGKYILKLISFFLPKSDLFSNPNQAPGVLQQLESWINQKMESIEKQRDTELNRLVKLFDKDKDMALQYAIPLNSPYLNRGTAPRTAKLTRRSLNLNIRGFGSGIASDAWDLGNYHWVLQQRYEKTAAELIASGDFKKAAYVYAHLLGDLFRSAQTLQQGRHYREAAAIFKDHLNNKSQAAECLESGGLLTEAIALYVEMENYEKAGDLHKQIGQHDKAVKYYEDVVSKSLSARDHLKASRIIELKIGDQQRSQQVLLDGWKDNNQSEKCLKQYFENITAEGKSLQPEIRQVFEKHVGKGKSTSYLNIIADITQHSTDNLLKAEALDLCYTIVAEQMSYGDYSGLKLMPRFMPDDSMIINDVSRYAVSNRNEVKFQKADYYIQLARDIQWEDFCAYHDQLIGIGIKDKNLHLLRMNWEGEEEYSYLFRTEGEAIYTLTSDPGLSADILINGPGIFGQNQKLPSSTAFEREASLHQLDWLRPSVFAVAVNSTLGMVTCMVTHGEDIRLNTYEINGRPLTSVVCLVDESFNISELSPAFSKMYKRKDHYYFTGRNMIVRMEHSGIMEVMALKHVVWAFSISGVHAALKIAVLTEGGCLIVVPKLTEMVIGTPYFAQGIGAHLVQLLPDNHVVLAMPKKAQVYDISGKRAELLFEVITDNDIVQILNVPKRNHFALLEADNRISIQVISNAR